MNLLHFQIDLMKPNFQIDSLEVIDDKSNHRRLRKNIAIFKDRVVGLRTKLTLRLSSCQNQNYKLPAYELIVKIAKSENCKLIVKIVKIVKKRGRLGNKACS